MLLQMIDKPSIHINFVKEINFYDKLSEPKEIKNTLLFSSILKSFQLHTPDRLKFIPLFVPKGFVTQQFQIQANRI